MSLATNVMKPWAKINLSKKDPLGGLDPYGASKACSEIISKSYYNSFIKKLGVGCTARAGNIIGGGDWSKNRLIPDIINSINKKKLVIRYPNATRPWQYILDPLTGYILLAQKLLNINQNIQGLGILALTTIQPKK